MNIYDSKYSYDKETYTASYTIYVRDRGSNVSFTGIAKCNPADIEMENSNVGITIANMRAAIKTIKYALKCSKEEYRNICNIYNYLQHSGCDVNSKEMTLIMREMKRTKDDIDYFKDEIAIDTAKLKSYLKSVEEYSLKFEALHNIGQK